MTHQQLFAQEILGKVKALLAELPADPRLNEVEFARHHDKIDIDLGDGKSIVISLWGFKREKS